MDKDILFFVKFGKKSDLKKMIKGSMHFSNAESFRKMEKEQLNKGQGDSDDSIFNVLAQDVTIRPNNSTEEPTVLHDVNAKIDCPENIRKAVLCITAGTSENCSYYKDESHYKIKFSDLQADLQANSIKNQFTEVDSALLIKRPMSFIKNVSEHIGRDCCSHKVCYYKYN